MMWSRTSFSDLQRVGCRAVPDFSKSEFQFLRAVYEYIRPVDIHVGISASSNEQLSTSASEDGAAKVSDTLNYGK